MILQKKKLLHIRSRCIGCAYCVEIAPDFWKMNEEDGKCDLIGGQEKRNAFELEVFSDDLPRIEKAIEICPTKCIKVEG